VSFLVELDCSLHRSLGMGGDTKERAKRRSVGKQDKAYGFSCIILAIVKKGEIQTGSFGGKIHPARNAAGEVNGAGGPQSLALRTRTGGKHLLVSQTMGCLPHGPN